MSGLVRGPRLTRVPDVPQMRLVPRRLRAALTVAVVMLLAGCGVLPDTGDGEPTAEAPDSIVVIAGVHQGMPRADIPVELQNTVITAIRAKAAVSVIANDGTPRVVFHTAGYTVNDANPQARDNDVDVVVRALLSAVRATQADSDGSNLGASLAIAGDQLTADEAQRGAIVVVDNGISDLGFPALTASGLIDTGTGDQLVEFAKANQQMLTLPQGTTVSLVGFGYTAAPQQDLTPTQRGNITRIWADYLQAAGATVTTITVPRVGDGPETTYTTTLVTPGTYEQLAISHSPDVAEAVLPADVLFDFGSSTLRTDAGTVSALTEAAEFVAATPGKVTITGYTDSIGDVADNLALSTARAASMRDWLLAHGIDRARMSIVGKGEADLVIPDATTAEQHQRNRRVAITITDLR